MLFVGEIVVAEGLTWKVINLNWFSMLSVVSSACVVNKPKKGIFSVCLPQSQEQIFELQF